MQAIQPSRPASPTSLDSEFTASRDDRGQITLVIVHAKGPATPAKGRKRSAPATQKLRSGIATADQRPAPDNGTGYRSETKPAPLTQAPQHGTGHGHSAVQKTMNMLPPLSFHNPIADQSDTIEFFPTTPSTSPPPDRASLVPASRVQGRLSRRMRCLAAQEFKNS